MENEALAKQVGRLVKRLRIAAGLSQEQFASASGLHRTYIGVVEHGEETIIVETASKLAKAFGLYYESFC